MADDERPVGADRPDGPDVLEHGAETIEPDSDVIELGPDGIEPGPDAIAPGSDVAERGSDGAEPGADVIESGSDLLDPQVAQDRQDGLEAQEADQAAEAPQSQASAELKAIVEALIFASPEPLTRKAIDKLLVSEPKEDIEAAIAALERDYDRPGGLQLVEVAGGYQITTRQNLHEWVRRLFHERTTQKLTVQALETLAVIAYKQPITAVEITEIRGVNTSGVVNTLLERHLVKIVGRKRVVGRPFLYATTKEFLIRFGLNDLTDLPRVEDMADALGFESPLLVEHTPGDEALPLEEPEEPEEDTPQDDEPGGSVH
ncbi:MAG: SMC-Scp complex subunit ScpB [Acidobacteriota bacterium]